MPGLIDKILSSLFGSRPAPPPAGGGRTRPSGRDLDATLPLPPLPASPPMETQPAAPDRPARVAAPPTVQRLLIGAAQDVGRVRPHNEDALLTFTGELCGFDSMPSFALLVVADGMGGHSLGERASGIAARAVARAVLDQILPSLLADPNVETERPALREVMENAMTAANTAVFTSVPEGGTTLTGALIIGEQVVLSHVGDTRAYIITADTFEQITRDHSLVQRLQELGQLSAAEAAVHPQRSILYRAIGQAESLEVDIVTRRLPPGARLLLCSDGLWGVVADDKIREIVLQAPSPQLACDQLVEAANAGGGPDNITAVIVQLPG